MTEGGRGEGICYLLRTYPRCSASSFLKVNVGAQMGFAIKPIGEGARVLCGFSLVGLAVVLTARSGSEFWPLLALLAFLGISLLLTGLRGQPG